MGDKYKKLDEDRLEVETDRVKRVYNVKETAKLHWWMVQMKKLKDLKPYMERRNKLGDLEKRLANADKVVKKAEELGMNLTRGKGNKANRKKSR